MTCYFCHGPASLITAHPNIKTQRSFAVCTSCQALVPSRIGDAECLSLLWMLLRATTQIVPPGGEVLLSAGKQSARLVRVGRCAISVQTMRQEDGDIAVDVLVADGDEGAVPLAVHKDDRTVCAISASGRLDEIFHSVPQKPVELDAHRMCRSAAIDIMRQIAQPWLSGQVRVLVNDQLFSEQRMMHAAVNAGFPAQQAALWNQAHA